MKTWPQLYSCKFLTAGLVSYEDSDAGIALLKKETIDRMLHTIIGRPIVIDHQPVTPDNIKVYSKGYVINASFHPEDGWFWADFLVDDDEAIKCIEEHDYSVSCAYNVLDVASGGSYQDIKYDGEIVDGSFTHLALVENPRYEESKITKQLPAMLVNGKVVNYQTEKQEENHMFKIFKKEGDKKVEVDSFVVINGKNVKVSELAEHYANAKKNEVEKGDDLTMAKDEDMVDVNGEKVSVKDLKNSFIKSNAKDDEQEKDEKKDVAEDKAKKSEDAEKDIKEAKDNEKVEDKPSKVVPKANDKEDEDKEEKKNEKLNAKAKGDEFFAELSNASKNNFQDDDAASPSPKTRAERAKEWAARNSK